MVGNGIAMKMNKNYTFKRKLNVAMTATTTDVVFSSKVS